MVEFAAVGGASDSEKPTLALTLTDALFSGVVVVSRAVAAAPVVVSLALTAPVVGSSVVLAGSVRARSVGMPDSAGTSFGDPDPVTLPLTGVGSNWEIASSMPCSVETLDAGTVLSK
ncbi:hypothetical protein [Nocardia sp. NPDC004604]|uniref:hypothetical protein n=1 Tax=Nocardia sp. NPDC004604 TaxID=3157013 RepID=UPI0033AAF9AA